MREVNCISGGKVVGKHKIWNFREIEDSEHFNIFDINTTVELDHCPFCGNTAILNQDTSWFGNCMICGTRGPSHWDWRKAAQMWNDRTLKSFLDCCDIDINRIIDEGFDIHRILPEQLATVGIKLEETKEDGNETA